MLPVPSVLRFFRRLLKIAGNDVGLHAVQDGAVKQQGVTFTSLRISRDLQPVNGHIADPAKGDGGFPSSERLGDPIEDELIGGANIREFGMQLQRKHEGVGQAAGSQQDGPPAAGPPKHRYPVLFAGGDMDIVVDAARTPEHDEMAVALPEPEHRIAAILLQLLEQRFVEGEILCRGREGEIEETQ